jgi:hypothetical protein
MAVLFTKNGSIYHGSQDYGEPHGIYNIFWSKTSVLVSRVYTVSPPCVAFTLSPNQFFAVIEVIKLMSAENCFGNSVCGWGRNFNIRNISFFPKGVRYKFSPLSQKSRFFEVKNSKNLEFLTS